MYLSCYIFFCINTIVWPVSKWANSHNVISLPSKRFSYILGINTGIWIYSIEKCSHYSKSNKGESNLQYPALKASNEIGGKTTNFEDFCCKNTLRQTLRFKSQIMASLSIFYLFYFLHNKVYVVDFNNIGQAKYLVWKKKRFILQNNAHCCIWRY